MFNDIKFKATGRYKPMFLCLLPSPGLFRRLSSNDHRSGSNVYRFALRTVAIFHALILLLGTCSKELMLNTERNPNMEKDV